MDKKILNDDVVLTEPTKEEELKQKSEDQEITETVPEDKLSNTPPEPKDLILNKEEYSKSLRSKLYPVNQRIDVGIDSDAQISTQHKQATDGALAYKESIMNLKEKLQGILKELEELENEEEKIIDEEVAGAAGIPGGAAAAMGPGTTTEAVAPWKEKIGKFSMFKRKKD